MNASPANDNTRSGSETTTLPRPAIPDHQLVRCIGSGSYGEVWLAQTITGTWRAVKVVSRTRFSDPAPFRREFLGIEKFEPLSRTHPGLVSVLHVGRDPDDTFFYYVMDLADDLQTGPNINPDAYTPRTLSQLLRQGPLPLPQCLAIGQTLADALAHLHRHDLIHRDIKPANIIFVNDIPRLADIGLVASSGARCTFVGTEGFIPPEGPGKPAADIYALGKVLYEISTGKDRTEFPELPEGLRTLDHGPQLMRFNDLLLKACAEKPWHRFASADELHHALSNLETELGFDPGVSILPQDKSARPRRLGLIFTTDDQSQLAQLLAHRLGTDGFELVLPRHTVLSTRWAREIEHQFKVADTVLLGLSDEALADARTAYAAELAAQSRFRTPTPPRLMVIRCQLKSPLPTHYDLAFGTAQFLDWNGPKDNASLLAAIQAAMT